MQPFRGTGSLVLLVGNVFKDCLRFLLLGLEILLGFAVTMCVLFRGRTSREAPGEAEAEHLGQSESSGVGGSVGEYDTIPKSALTLFVALLGNFEIEAQTSFPVLSRNLSP